MAAPRGQNYSRNNPPNRRCIWGSDDGSAAEDDSYCAACDAKIEESGTDDGFVTGSDASDDTPSLCGAGDLCPLAEVRATCCGRCVRRAVARVPGVAATGVHPTAVSACGHTVCAAIIAAGDDAFGDMDALVRKRRTKPGAGKPAAVGSAGGSESDERVDASERLRRRCPACRRRDRRAADNKRQRKRESHDEPILEALLGRLRSESGRKVAERWLVVHRRLRSLPADPTDAAAEVADSDDANNAGEEAAIVDPGPPSPPPPSLSPRPAKKPRLPHGAETCWTR